MDEPVTTEVEVSKVTTYTAVVVDSLQFKSQLHVKVATDFPINQLEQQLAITFGNLGCRVVRVELYEDDVQSER